MSGLKDYKEVFMKNILVTYASKYGSTAEIAEKIGEVLRGGDLNVSILPSTEVRDASSYEAVILGSGVYAGHWLKEIVAFLENNDKILAKKPVWIFSSGPTGEGDPVDIMHGWRFPEAQQVILDLIKPRDITLFHGNIDMHKLHLGDKLIVKAVRAKVGDFRNWDAIVTWAKGIASALQPHPEVVT
jgi:menaquinone-dependent protoporphyrinogen oxidase